MPRFSLSKIACDRRSMRVPDRAQDFRGAVDDRLEQSVEHGLRLVAAAAGLHGPGHEHVERARLAVAHGDEGPFGQDERDVDELRRFPYRSCTGRAPSCSARCSRDRGSRTARYPPSPPGSGSRCRDGSRRAGLPRGSARSDRSTWRRAGSAHPAGERCDRGTRPAVRRPLPACGSESYAFLPLHDRSFSPLPCGEG